MSRNGCSVNSPLVSGFWQPAMKVWSRTSIGYVDDGSLILCGHRLDEILKEMNIALQNYVDWAKDYVWTETQWRKTSYIIFTNKKCSQFEIPNFGITLNGRAIRWDTSIKYLRAYLDHKLDWNTHIEEKTKQAKKLGAITPKWWNFLYFMSMINIRVLRICTYCTEGKRSTKSDY